jgi:hypothetical protein
MMDLSLRKDAAKPSRVRDVQLSKKIAALDWEDPAEAHLEADRLVMNELKSLGYDHAAHAIESRVADGRIRY